MAKVVYGIGYSFARILEAAKARGKSEAELKQMVATCKKAGWVVEVDGKIEMTAAGAKALTAARKGAK